MIKGELRDKDDMYKLIYEGNSVEEIADKYSCEKCIVDIGISPEYCNEDIDCNDCWVRCLNEELERNKSI